MEGELFKVAGFIHCVQMNKLVHVSHFTSRNRSLSRRCIYNPAKDLLYKFFVKIVNGKKQLIVFFFRKKSYIVDILLGSEYASDWC